MTTTTTATTNPSIKVTSEYGEDSPLRVITIEIPLKGKFEIVLDTTNGEVMEAMKL